jgi:hypothetical protein
MRTLARKRFFQLWRDRFPDPDASPTPNAYTVWICTRLVVPGRPEGSPAVMPTR